MNYIPRELEQKLKKFLGRREIIGIQGPHQSGKTTLLKKIFEDLDRPKAFINLDILEERTALSRDPISFLRRRLPEGKGYLFLDEVQNVENAGESLKIIFDEFPGVKMFVSGSSSLKLRSDISTKLVGRFVSFDLLSFSFYEFLLSRDRGLADIHLHYRDETLSFLKGGSLPREPTYEDSFKNLFVEYLTYGGYPAVVLEGDEEVKQTLLKGLLSLYIDRDVVGFFSIAILEKFLSVLRYLATTSGSILSVSSLASNLGISYKTAEKFLTVLEMGYIVRRVRTFHRNLVTELKKSPKIYFYDVGLRNAVIGDFTQSLSRGDIGILLENYVFGELQRLGIGVKYWRTTAKTEVDFVIPSDPPIPIEVKALGKPEKGFYNFIRHYGVKRALVFTDRFEVKERGGATIAFLPWWYI